MINRNKGGDWVGLIRKYRGKLNKKKCRNKRKGFRIRDWGMRLELLNNKKEELRKISKEQEYRNKWNKKHKLNAYNDKYRNKDS